MTGLQGYWNLEGSRRNVRSVITVDRKQRTDQNAIHPRANCLESSLKKVRSAGGQVSLALGDGWGGFPGVVGVGAVPCTAS